MSSERGKKIKRFASQKAIYIVLLVLILVIVMFDWRFLSPRCLMDILLQSATRIIIALGMCFVILIGGVDLAAGRIVGFAAVVSSSMLQTADYVRRFYPALPQLPVWIPVVLAVISGLIAGLISGFVVSKLDVVPFIATLGTSLMVYGVCSIYFNIHPNESQPIGGLRDDFKMLGSGRLFGFPIILLIAIVITIIVWIVLNKTCFGKNVYAIGGNVEAAKVSGVNVSRTLLAVFAIAGALFAFAGVLEAARTGGATNNYGNMYELDAIAACVVGGVSSTGGIGTVPGVVAGVLIFQVINYGLTFIGVNPYWQLIIKGIIIVSAVSVDIRKYVAKK